MTTDAPVGHGAAASALGYQHQINWALVELLRRGATRPDQSITMELHDDVAWEQAGHPLERIQVKHHLNRQFGLGDANPDLWRTLKVWMDSASPTDPSGSLLTLVTTATAGQGSAGSFLQRRRRTGPGRVREPVEAAIAAFDAMRRPKVSQPLHCRYAVESDRRRSDFQRIARGVQTRTDMIGSWM